MLSFLKIGLHWIPTSNSSLPLAIQVPWGYSSFKWCCVGCRTARTYGRSYPCARKSCQLLISNETVRPTDDHIGEFSNTFMPWSLALCQKQNDLFSSLHVDYLLFQAHLPVRPSWMSMEYKEARSMSFPMPTWSELFDTNMLSKFAWSLALAQKIWKFW